MRGLLAAGAVALLEVVGAAVAAGRVAADGLVLVLALARPLQALISWCLALMLQLVQAVTLARLLWARSGLVQVLTLTLRLRLLQRSRTMAVMMIQMTQALLLVPVKAQAQAQAALLAQRRRRQHQAAGSPARRLLTACCLERQWRRRLASSWQPCRRLETLG